MERYTLYGKLRMAKYDDIEALLFLKSYMLINPLEDRAILGEPHQILLCFEHDEIRFKAASVLFRYKTYDPLSLEELKCIMACFHRRSEYHRFKLFKKLAHLIDKKIDKKDLVTILDGTFNDQLFIKEAILSLIEKKNILETKNNYSELLYVINDTINDDACKYSILKKVIKMKEDITSKDMIDTLFIIRKDKYKMYTFSLLIDKIQEDIGETILINIFKLIGDIEVKNQMLDIFLKGVSEEEIQKISTKSRIDLACFAIDKEKREKFAILLGVDKFINHSHTESNTTKKESINKEEEEEDTTNGESINKEEEEEKTSMYVSSYGDYTVSASGVVETPTYYINGRSVKMPPNYSSMAMTITSNAIYLGGECYYDINRIEKGYWPDRSK